MKSKLFQKKVKPTTVKRVQEDSPYVDYKDRCVFAVETVRSYSAPVADQVVELELMALFSGMNTDEEMFLALHRGKMAKIQAAREAARKRNG